MAIVFDTNALLRPRFIAADFVPTKWDSAATKADFASRLCQFIAADFKESLFTKVFYNRLHLTYGHIARCNREGFFGTFFRDLAGKVEFLEHTLQWRCFGDLAFTYCDVERSIQERLQRGDLLTAYRALRAADIERGERDTLRRLSAQYEGAAVSTASPVVIARSRSPEPRAKSAAEQPRLF